MLENYLDRTDVRESYLEEKTLTWSWRAGFAPGIPWGCLQNRFGVLLAVPSYFTSILQSVQERAHGRGRHSEKASCRHSH